MTARPLLDRAVVERAALDAAHAAFGRHQIRDRALGRWEIQARTDRGAWEDDLACAVAVLRPVGRAVEHGLIVYGDVETVVWSGYRPRGEVRAVDVVQWMGRDLDLRTVRARFVRGLGVEAGGLTEAVDARVLRADIHQQLGPNARDAALAILDEYEVQDADTCETVVSRLLWEDMLDGEMAGWFGRVTTDRVLRAYAAVVRLATLLAAEPG